MTGRRAATKAGSHSAAGGSGAASGETSRVALLGRLAAGPPRIADAAQRAAVREAAAAPREGWTARQVVAHLALVEQVVFHARLDQLAAGRVPRWPWTEPGTSDAPALATLEAVTEAFAARRAETLARVGQLDEPGWRRVGIHATYGRLDVAGLLGVIADHDDEHRLDLEARAG
jgi:hypothetical protein